MTQVTRRTMSGRKRSGGRTIFGGTRGWIAASLAAYSVVGGTKSALAAKAKTDPAATNAPVATLPLKKFDHRSGTAGVVASLPTSAVNTALPCPYTASSNPSTMVVNRNQIQTKSVESDLWHQTEVSARFKLFGVKNSLVAGVEGGQEISNPIRSN